MKSKNLTMETVALKAGVSITTVSHVINRTRHVNQSTKDAVLGVMKELNYRPSRIVRSKAKSNICVGVILADAREDYYIEMIKAIESVAADYGIQVIFCDSEADFKKEEKNIATLLDRHINGILLAPSRADKMPDILNHISIPVVLIDRQYDSHTHLSVGINNFHSSYLGTRYLYDKGCKRIGFISYSESVYTNRQRVLGYKAAVMESDTRTKPKVLHLPYSGGDSFPLIKQFVIENRFDGFLCITSSLCYELIEVFDTLDDEIKKNTKITTFDDNRWFDYIKYPVSVILQPVAEIGNAALENLLQMIEKPENSYDVKRELLFDVTIIDRIKPP
jgi:LacI family transcriptional regulator